MFGNWTLLIWVAAIVIAILVIYMITRPKKPKGIQPRKPVDFSPAMSEEEQRRRSELRYGGVRSQPNAPRSEYTPNSVTAAALDAAERGETKRFDSVDSMMKDLNDKVDSGGIQNTPVYEPPTPEPEAYIPPPPPKVKPAPKPNPKGLKRRFYAVNEDALRLEHEIREELNDGTTYVSRRFGSPAKATAFLMDHTINSKPLGPPKGQFGKKV